MSGAGWIRATYGVPAKRGMVILYDGHSARIVGFRGNYLRVRHLSDPTFIDTLHPTWHVEYPTVGGDS